MRFKKKSNDGVIFMGGTLERLVNIVLKILGGS